MPEEKVRRETELRDVDLVLLIYTALMCRKTFNTNFESDAFDMLSLNNFIKLPSGNSPKELFIIIMREIDGCTVLKCKKKICIYNRTVNIIQSEASRDAKLEPLIKLLLSMPRIELGHE